MKKYLLSSVGKNATSLYIIHFANYLLPLITVPYVVRVLTPRGYGMVAFGQSFLGYFSVLVEYGFGFSATRKISVSRDDPAAISRIAASVWGAKFFLCLAAFIILVSVVFTFSALKEYQILLLTLYLQTLGNVLFPVWLYQGMERMVFISVINLSIRLLFVVSIFIFIKKPDDYLLYAGLSSLSSILAGILGFLWSLHLFSLRLTLPSFQEILEALKEGWVLFLSTASVSLYTVGNAFILGMLTNPTVVGYYSAGEKIVKSVLGLIGPLSQAAYPRFAKMAADSKEMAQFWAHKMILLMGGLGFSLSIMLIIIAPIFVRYFLGPEFMPSITVVQILAFLIFFVSISNVLGVQVMFSFHYDKAVSCFVFIGGLLNLFLAIILAPMLKADGMALSVVICECFITISFICYLYHKDINVFSPNIRLS